MDSETRFVARHEHDGHTYSTVFLALDHNFGGGKPILYETLVFPEGSLSEVWGTRYHTREEALAGHFAKLREDGWEPQEAPSPPTITREGLLFAEG